MGDSPLTVIVRRVVVVGYQARGAGIGVNVVGSRGQVGVMVLAKGNIDNSRRPWNNFLQQLCDGIFFWTFRVRYQAVIVRAVIIRAVIVQILVLHV